MNTNHLNDIRTELHKVSTSEFFMIHDNEGVKDLWMERQALIQEMNQAVAEAVAKVKETYADRLRDIDQQYAMFLQLSMPRAEDSR